MRVTNNYAKILGFISRIINQLDQLSIKIWLLILLRSPPMKAYQFKTLNPLAPALRTEPSPSFPQAGMYTLARVPAVVTRTESPQKPRLSTQGSSAQRFNIDDLKQKLASMLKQTDQIASRNRISYDGKQSSNNSTYSNKRDEAADTASYADSKPHNQYITRASKYQGQDTYTKVRTQNDEDTMLNGTRVKSYTNLQKTTPQFFYRPESQSFPAPVSAKLEPLNDYNPQRLLKLTTDSTRKQPATRNYQQYLQRPESASSAGLNSLTQQKPKQSVITGSNRSELTARLTTLESENQGLKGSLKNATDTKQYYREQVNKERNKAKQLQEQFTSKIEQIKLSNNQALQQQQKDILRLEESFRQQINQAKQVHNQELKQIGLQIEEKQRKILQLVRQIGEQQSAANEEQQNGQEVGHEYLNLVQLLHEHQNQIEELKSEISVRNKTIGMMDNTMRELKLQVQELKAFKKQMDSPKYNNFDEILMNQMQTMAHLKEKIQALYETSNELRDRLAESERRNQWVVNDINIMELKQRSEFNNRKMEQGIHQGSRDNSISSLNKKMITLEQKIRHTMNEIKTKDEFFRQYLLGRTQKPEEKEHIDQVLSQYRQTGTDSKDEVLIEELKKARRKLELYEKYA